MCQITITEAGSGSNCCKMLSSASLTILRVEMGSSWRAMLPAPCKICFLLLQRSSECTPNAAPRVALSAPSPGKGA